MAASSPTSCAAVPSEARHSWSARSDQDSPKLIKMHDFTSRPIQSQKCVQNPISKNLTKLARGPLAHESASVIPLPVVPLLLSLFWLTVRLVLTLDNVDTKKNHVFVRSSRKRGADKTQLRGDRYSSLQNSRNRPCGQLRLSRNSSPGVLIQS